MGNFQGTGKGDLARCRVSNFQMSDSSATSKVIFLPRVNNYIFERVSITRLLIFPRVKKTVISASRMIKSVNLRAQQPKRAVGLLQEMGVLKEEEKLVEWFQEKMLPKMVAEGSFPAGRNPRIVSCEFHPTERNTDHFCSVPYFMELVLDSEEGRKSFDLVVKFCVQNDRAIELMNVRRQYQNEVGVYGRIFAEFKALLRGNPKAPQDLLDDIVPKCYYSFFCEEDLKRSFLVFTNLKKLRYRNSESLVSVDFEHSAAAVRQLARFHAFSFALKIKYPERLLELAGGLIECRYFDDPRVMEMMEVFHHRCNQRAINYLLSLDNPPIPKDYILRFRQLVSKPYDLMLSLISPKEPLAVICHGDFCRNNMLFKYEDGRVVDVKLFDFQTSRYASPSVDLSFFLYMSTSQDLRDKHLDELLEIYYSTVVSTTATILGVPEKEVGDRFPKKLFSEDFAEHAVYAYHHVAFFLAAMNQKETIDWSKSLEERADELNAVGGDKISKEIANVIVDYYKRNFYMNS